MKILPSKCSHYSSVIEPAEDDLIMGERAAARANSTLNKCLVSMLSISSSLKFSSSHSKDLRDVCGEECGSKQGSWQQLGKSIWKEGC